MKKLFYFALVLLMGKEAYANNKKDSIIVNVGEKSRIVVFGEKREDLRKLLRYDLNAVLRDMGAKIDSSEGKTRIIIDEKGKKYNINENATIEVIKDKNQKRVTVSIGKNNMPTIEKRVNVVVKDSIHIEQIDSKLATVVVKHKKRDWYNNKSTNFVLSLGLNAYGNNETKLAMYNLQEYDLKPLGSRYVALGFYRGGTLIKGEHVALRVRTGVEFSWYNLMFEGDNVAKIGTNRVEFPVNTAALDKSKLTVSYVNLPLMFNTVFRSSFITHIGVGGYAGYRLDSYTKLKTNEGSVKYHNHNGYYLNNFRYGLSAEIGFRKSLDLFFNYDLNPLFQDQHGPNVNMLSFGVRFN
jgi:Outer membrane protein beta-barrel domain